MNYLKIVTIVNSVVIALLFLLVMAETLFPTKGGDAASGMGRAIYYVAIILLVLLSTLNLLPFNWSKYTAFVIIVVPVFWVAFGSSISNFKRGITNWIEAKPLFEDKERDRMAVAIFNAKPDQLKKYIAEVQPRLWDNAYGYPLLEMAVANAGSVNNDGERRLESIRALLQAGVSIKSDDPDVEKIHFSPATSGNAPVLRLLLEHGADANARVTDYGSGKRDVVPIVFEALATSYGAYACVKALLDHGADPNAIMPWDGDHEKMSVLLYAAERQYWGVCRMLIEKGADPRYTTPDGISLQTFIEQGDSFYPENKQALADFEAVRAIVERLQTTGR
ncbi:MAG: ankyrin repeat domain-containing protein [Dyadobacter sp.]|uniref:ankyrin repeat domain-containing protein n=1 Tax=Dyadobacter sp. TaxID=1914288 RepID=UPI001B10533D|nr:ankyrin repeat domain-containing protein [Dyadobacter sp.]MBO9613295.1 ankyrin repeat domain-containing protein [Dyadobacter sp.]